MSQDRWITTTQWFLLALLAAVTLYDIIAAKTLGEGATVSVIVADASSKYPIIAFAIGVLAGHVFWEMKK